MQYKQDKTAGHLNRIRVLYISYEGMLEPLGQSQVLAYQERLAESRETFLLSFEKPDDWTDIAARKDIGQRISAAGIHWCPRLYHKRPSALATAYDILVGILVGLWLILRRRIGVVHARSYVPAVMALILKKLTGVKFVFDMRGFWADERVDGGLWPGDGRMYKVAKWFERQFLLNADQIISLTHAAAREIEGFTYLKGNMPSITIIPTCADLERFSPPDIKPESEFVLGYVGSAGTWYLFDEVICAFKHLLKRCPDALLMILNRNEHAYIKARLATGGVSSDKVKLVAAEHAEVPLYMTGMTAGVFFYKPSYSRAACAPTKFGEFLGCGIPCLSNRGVGDMAEIMDDNGVGIAVSDFSENVLSAAIDDLVALTEDHEMPSKCRAAALQYFSLDEGVRRYQAVYDSLSETK
jgi:glycosyltransferase involved in cell wall biosynthesis